MLDVPNVPDLPPSLQSVGLLRSAVAAATIAKRSYGDGNVGLRSLVAVPSPQRPAAPLRLSSLSEVTAHKG